MKNLEIFREEYIKGMQEKNVRFFERDYPTLLKVILSSMDKAIQVQAPVSPNFGGKIAEIRNLFSPILNMFTVAKEQKKYWLKVDKESRKQSVYLDKIEIAEKHNIMKNGIAEKIKTLLDEIG